MNLRQLEVFAAVVECGQVTKAAEKLFIAQPSVSQTLADIEHEYDILLFERLNKKLHITEDGKKLYEMAKLLMADMQKIDEFLDYRGRVGSVRLGGTVTVGNTVLPQLIKSISERKEINFEKIIVDNTQNIESKILDGSLDLAIVEGAVYSDSIIVKSVMSDDIIFVAGADYCSDIMENFIVREFGSGTRELVVEYMRKHKIYAKNIWEVSSTEAIINLLKLGNIATAISKRCVSKHIKRGILKQINEHKIHRNFYLLYHKDKKFTDNLNLVVEEICKKGIERRKSHLI